MKNYEKYEKEIRKADGGGCDFKKKHVLGCNCDGLTCNKCWNKFLDWLMQEYKEPPIDWSKVPIDTPVYLNAFGNADAPRYFCKYENGYVFLFDSGRTSWSGGDRSTQWTTEQVRLARPEDIEKYSI